MYVLLAMFCALQIGGAVTPHDGQCHLRSVTVEGVTYYEYEEALRLVRKACNHFSEINQCRVFSCVTLTNTVMM